MSFAMERYPGISAPAGNIARKKATARVALVDVKEPAHQVLHDCFRQFGVEAVAMTGAVGDRLRREKFDACVLRLSPESENVMDAVRGSASNSRMVIYGLGGSAQEALKYSKYGINAVFHEPVERSSALKLVRATQMLVLHEFRRYARVPIITEVSVSLGGENHFVASTREISAGGMSLTSAQEVGVNSPVEVSFALLTLPRIWIRGTVSWRKTKSFGVRFDVTDNRRLRIKQWIEGYLEA
jgi:PilZ domain